MQEIPLGNQKIRAATGSTKNDYIIADQAKKQGDERTCRIIEVSGLGRIRQRDSGVSLWLLVQELLQKGFEIDPDEFGDAV